MTGSEIVARRMGKITSLTPETHAMLSTLRPAASFAAGSSLIGEQGPLTPRFLVSGWAARVRHLSDGRRQIVAFVLPGDGVGICARPQPLSLCPVVALTPVQTVDASPVVEAVFDHRRSGPEDLAHALHLSAALDENFLMDQTVRLGRQTALERMAHLFLELRYRQQLVDAADRDAYHAPLTQDQIADAMGLSAVHVNRTMQQLRRDGLMEFSQGRVVLHRPGLLEAIADWRPPQLSGWDTRSGRRWQ